MFCSYKAFFLGNSEQENALSRPTSSHRLSHDTIKGHRALQLIQNGFQLTKPIITLAALYIT